jgi:Tfp pilus assembly protein PilF
VVGLPGASSKGGESTDDAATEGETDTATIDVATGYVALGLQLLQRQLNNDALVLLERATKLQPTSGESHSHYGTALQTVGSIDEAIKKYRLAVQLAPAHLNAHFNLAHGLVERPLSVDTAQEAVAALKVVLESDPEQPQAKELMGFLQQQLQQSRVEL